MGGPTTDSHLWFLFNLSTPDFLLEKGEFICDWFNLIVFGSTRGGKKVLVRSRT